MIEKEIKVLLTQEKYNLLLENLLWDEYFTQINYYYRSDNTEDDEITVRIREKRGAYKLQVKIPKVKDNSLHIKEEFETEADKVYDCIDNEMLSILTGYNFTRKFILVGSLKTESYVVKKTGNVEIALDKNYYLDTTDYEVEIEYSEEYPQQVIDMLKKYNIQTNNKVLSKNSRFVQKLHNSNNGST